MIDAGEQHRLAGAQRQIVEQELRGEVVAAVEDQVVTGGEPIGVAGIETQRVRLDAHFGIERAHALRRERGFLAAAIGERVPGLAMQVRRLEPVAVDDAEAADAGAREILQHRNAETAGADDQHGRRAQARLARGADFAQRDLARVVRRSGGGACVIVLVRMVVLVRRARARRGAAQRSQFTQPESPLT